MVIVNTASFLKQSTKNLPFVFFQTSELRHVRCEHSLYTEQEIKFLLLSNNDCTTRRKELRSSRGCLCHVIAFARHLMLLAEFGKRNSESN